MNERLLQIWQNGTTYLKGLPRQAQIGLGLLAGALVIGGIIGSVLYHRDPYQILYADLQAEDSRAIAKKLSDKNIPYQATDENRTILVPQSQVAQARMQLAKEGLPGNDVVGFEKFDSGTLGMSSYVQRIQYVRAVQGELVRSIQRLAWVKSARVHISIPPRKTFMEEEEPPKASVVIELRAGQQPSKTEIHGIAHLVASAVEGLKVTQVTVVDTKGNFLHRPEDENANGISSALLEMQRNIESEYEKRVEEILLPVVGYGKVRAKVTAEMDPARVNTTEETFDPDKATLRTLDKTDENNTGQRPNPIGIPGSRSNLPGAEAQNPSVPMAQSNQEKNHQTANYAIPRKVQVVDKPSGGIKRITVAVVVDGNYQKGADGKETFSPRSEEELKRLQELVANAVGFDVQRRDSITVSSLPFHLSDVPVAEQVTGSWWQRDELFNQLIRNGLFVGLVLLFLFLVVRPTLNWAFKNEEAEAALAAGGESFPKTVAELEAAAAAGASGIAGGAASGAGTLPMPEEIEPLEKKETEQLRNRVIERLERAPKKGVRIVQEWLDQDIPRLAAA